MLERISKFLSRAGVCSRRQAEKLIDEGRIKVDGQRIQSPITLVNSQSIIHVDGVAICQPEKTRVWCYYKPAGYLTTHHDPEGRLTVFQDLKQYNLPRVISIGRLDLNSEGLLLLTNNGEFSRFAELPKTGWERRYRVRVFGTLDVPALLDLSQGITIEGIHYGAIKVEINNPNYKSANHWLYVTLSEGKNREIRKVMNHLNLQVSRLIRETYGPFSLGNLQPHGIVEVPTVKVKKAFPGNN